MIRNLFIVFFALSLLLPTVVSGQATLEPRGCADLPGLTSATHKFQRLGETIEIVIRGESLPASLANCEPEALSLHWSNGRNNGSNFNVTFLDDNDRPIYAKQISAFQSGVSEFPLSTFDARRVYGSSLAMIAVPTRITIQAVSPFAAPVTLSYHVISVDRARRKDEDGNRAADAKQPAANQKADERGNEVVSIHTAVRLIGATRLLLVQIELKTDRPFPVSDKPLQLQIGKRVFSDELSGEYTGRKLTLTLTPELFAALNEGDEIVAFFGNSDYTGANVWNFGKLRKALSGRQ
jgi:hypothetical protein